MKFSSVRPEDLLARESQPVYGEEAMALIRDQVVLVTGAGGSIGSEIVRQCVRLGAARIIKVDNCENALFNLSLDLYDHSLFRPQDDLYLVDVSEPVSIANLVRTVRPDVIFHAAAVKHLPMTEAHPNMAVRVNVLGTHAVIKAAAEYGVPRVVNISTDKAANPSSALGWSKRLAELVGASLSDEFTKVTSVRFGNVLGSSGSLLPTLHHRMSQGLSFPIVHLEATRFFMTIPEATGLVIEAARMSEGGEVFILDMGDPVQLVELIRKFARLSDLPMPHLEVVGLRKGEKLHEELFSSQDRRCITQHARIFKTEVCVDADIDLKLKELHMLLESDVSPSALLQALSHNTKEA